MSKVYEKIIDRFDGGITNNSRDKSENTARVITYFDTFSEEGKLIPYKATQAVTTIAATTQALAQLKNFLMYGGTLYGLGVKDGENKIKIYSNSDLTASTWVAVASAEDTSNGTHTQLFIEYKGTIWGDAGGTRLWSHVLSGSTFTSSAQAITYTAITPGLVHSKDDILYFGYTNSTATYIASKNGAAGWNITALTLPTNLSVVSICEYGNYLAIGCKSTETTKNSVVFLWDRDSSVTTLSESIDWGDGQLQFIEQVDGFLIGLSAVGGSSFVLEDKIVFRYLNGNKAEKFKEIVGELGTLGNSIRPVRQIVNNRLYFLMKITINGSVREGLWSLGRPNTSSPFSLVHERTPNNATALTSGVMHGFFLANDYAHISYTDNSVVSLSKTNGSATGTSGAIYESVKYDGGDPSITKKLIGVTVNYEPTDGGTITLKYRIEGETSYTTIFAHTATLTTNSHSAINIESTGVTLPEFKEIEFQLTVTGAVEIIGLSFKAEVTGKRLYE